MAWSRRTSNIFNFWLWQELLLLLLVQGVRRFLFQENPKEIFIRNHQLILGRPGLLKKGACGGSTVPSKAKRLLVSSSNSFHP